MPTARIKKRFIYNKLSITVTITQNPVTMEYGISFGDRYPGVGSSEDPLCPPNYTTPVLPSTGGALLIAAAACLLYIQNKRRRGAQTSD